VDKAKWNALELAAVFNTLQANGLIWDFSATEYLPGRLNISCQCFCGDENGSSDYFYNSLSTLLTHKIVSAFAPFRCSVTGTPASGLDIDVCSGCRLDLTEKKDITFQDPRSQGFGGKHSYPYSAIVPALKKLEQLGLIAELDLSSRMDVLPLSIKFVYTNLAVRDCLATEGNILELYIWNEARRTRFFDNVQPNFSFTWDEGVSNELDVILTKDLTSLIVSAKTAKFNKEHLYEVKCLTERFSLNSKPVIVYTSTQAVENGKITGSLLAVKNRARAMGIHLVDLNDLKGPLGEKLVRIATGQDLP
jgi:hypothetical protein